MKRIWYLFIVLIFFSVSCFAQEIFEYPIAPVNITQVKLTDHFWLPKIKTIQNTTIQYALNKCVEEGRLDNFLIAGGVLQGETKGQMPFDDTDVYKIIEGVSYSLLMSPDKKLEAQLDSLIGIIATGQESDGYLTTWRTINPQKPPADWVQPGKRWHDLGSSHELYNSGHMFEAAAAHYRATGKKNFLNIAIRNADLLVNTFGKGNNPYVPGHQIVETGLIKLYQITKNSDYLKLSKHFLDERGDSTKRELFGSYSQDHIPVVQQDEVVGHAVRAVYMYAGMTDIAAIYHDKAYENAVKKLWENMVYKKMYVTGGIGASRNGEAFGENYALPNLTAYSETCAAIGSVYWNHRLFLLTGEKKYYDVIERTLYNGVLAGISLDGDEFFYPNPLESNGQLTFNQGSCTRKSWFNCSCCPTNLIRFIPSVPNMIYATKDDTLFVNLYMSNESNVNLNGSNIEVTQETEYPWEGNIRIVVSPEKASDFTLKLRVPGWVENDAVPGNLYDYLGNYKSNLQLIINGKKENLSTENGYLTINREWSGENSIELDFPMTVKRVTAIDSVADDRNSVAFEYGPIVFCAEQVDNKVDLSEISIPDNAVFKVTKKDNLFDGINTLSAKIKAPESDEVNDITMIPYYAWSNRGIGKMKVWLPRVIINKQ